MDIVIEPVKAASEITRIVLGGRIDSYTVERVQEEINSLIRIGSSKIICNLSAVEFVAGPGLKVFLKSMQGARKQQGDLKLCALRPEVEKMFQLAGFTRVATLYTSESDALRAFGVEVASVASGGYDQTLIAGASFEQTMIAPAGGMGFEQTMVPGANSGFEQTMIPGQDIGFEQTMVAGGQQNAGGLPAELRKKMLNITSCACGEKKGEVDAVEQLKKKLATMAPPVPEEAAELDDCTCMTILDQIDEIEATLVPGSDTEVKAQEPPVPAKPPSAFSVAQILSPVIQPVELALPNHESHLKDLTTLVGALGSLAGISSMKMVKFGVVITEVCRACMSRMDKHAALSLVVNAGDREIGVTVCAAAEGLNLYECLRPKLDSSIATAAAAEEWLVKSVGSVKILHEGKYTKIELSHS